MDWDWETREICNIGFFFFSVRFESQVCNEIIYLWEMTEMKTIFGTEF